MENKQIEEMAKTVCHLDRTCDECMTSFECKAMMYAKRFYNAGYRKASEVAREIFEEIEKIIDEKYNRFVFKNQPYDSDEETDAIINYSDTISDAINELKKKYTEGWR